jgi:hypothetical protein
MRPPIGRCTSVGGRSFGRYHENASLAGATKIAKRACSTLPPSEVQSKLLNGKRICRGCFARRAAVPCTRCGAVREPAARDTEGGVKTSPAWMLVVPSSQCRIHDARRSFQDAVCDPHERQIYVGTRVVRGQVRAALGYPLEPLVGERVGMVAVLVRDHTAWKVPPPASPAPIPIDSRAMCWSAPVIQPNAYKGQLTSWADELAERAVVRTRDTGGSASRPASLPAPGSSRRQPSRSRVVPGPSGESHLRATARCRWAAVR